MKNEAGLVPHPAGNFHSAGNSRWIEVLNSKRKPLNLLVENISDYPSDLRSGKISLKGWEKNPLAIKGKIDTFDCTKIKNFCSSKDIKNFQNNLEEEEQARGLTAPYIKTS